MFQVATFSTLHLHQSELDPAQVLADAMVIADEVDAQLMETAQLDGDQARRERGLAMHVTSGTLFND